MWTEVVEAFRLGVGEGSVELDAEEGNLEEA
jgi:hypothetical protein